jgi:predicted ester cyclase
VAIIRRESVQYASSIVALTGQDRGETRRSVMSAEENKAIIRRFVETVWNGHDTSAVGDFHADEFTLNGEPYTPSQFASGIAGLFEFYSDLRETIEAIVAEEDRVAYRWIMAGTDPRTGERRSWRGISMSRLADGKIVEEWYNNDQTDAEIKEIVEWLEARR